MGNCYKASSNENNGDRIYDKKACINIKCPNYSEKVSFHLTVPEKVERKTFSFNKIEFALSCCVIPGQDPRGEIEKICQDDYFFAEHKETLIIGAFDGHGKYGRDVVHYCGSFMKAFFLEHNFIGSPKEFLLNLIEECDRSILTTSKINCSTSGTTAVIILLNQQEIWACSVGDSRAILGTLPKYQKMTEYLNTNSNSPPYKKPIIPTRILKSIALTLDQKPNISYELERIIKSGGIVQQLSNSEGVKIGPYRVWKQGGKVPGLAMSRSIGDSIAKSIGVISKPIIYNLPLSHGRDQFIALGSDGIWDVIDNLEATNFVEKYKKTCATSVNLKKERSTQNNCVIAELLCEEARYRWLGVCSEEDVPIDDISAIVIEIRCKEPVDELKMTRKGISTEQSVELSSNDSPVLCLNERFDMKRGSNAAIAEEDNEEDDEE